MRPRRSVLVPVCVLVVAACTPASPDVDTYEQRVSLTLGTAVSDVATVERVLRLLDRGELFAPTAVTQIRNSEDGLGTAATALEEVNPPPPSDALSERCGNLLDQAEDLLQEARIKVKRGEAAVYADLAAKLAALGDELERLEKQLQ